jgi:hypothetical protein
MARHRPIRVLCLIGLLFSGDVVAGEVPVSAQLEISCVDSERAATAVGLWSIGAGLKAVALTAAWTRSHSPRLMGLQQLSLGIGLTFTAGAVLSHMGAIRQARVLASARTEPEYDRLPIIRGIYAGSILLPPIRPVGIRLGIEQLSDLEAACTNSPI